MSKNAEILSHLYGLLMEMNAARKDEDVLAGIDLDGDEFIQRHLRNVRLLSAKYGAVVYKKRFETIKQKLRQLRDLGEDEFSKMLSPSQTAEFMPLFRKFKELPKEDEESLLQDAQFLQILKSLDEEGSEG
jgi:hypothetical protein